MSKKDIETRILRDVYKSILPKVNFPDKGDGWINLATYGAALKKEGVDFRSLGFEKLLEFIIEVGLFDIYSDNNIPPVKYIKEKRVDAKRKVSTSTIIADVEDISRIKTRLRLENEYFIGQFAPCKEPGKYSITDIRNTDFTKIEDKERGVKNLKILFSSKENEFNKFAYHRFTWTLLESTPLKFGIDLSKEIIPLFPDDIVTCISDSIKRYPAGAAKKITRSLDTLNKQLTQSGKEVFIYELLQNANDYPKKSLKSDNSVPVPVPVDVEFHITGQYLTFQHTGDYFSPKNIAAICDINDGEKSENSDAIGYKGIGFKTVFLDNDYVYLNTGNYTFRFDKYATDITDTPWQILPVWTDPRTVHPVIQKLFDIHPNDKYRVKFALKPREKEILSDRTRKDNYIDLFTNVFETERVILFIPNIRSVRVFFSEKDLPDIDRRKDNSNWCVSEALTENVPDFVQNRINEVLENPDSDMSDGYIKIPEKYKDFKRTAVRFACKKEGRRLLPVDKAILYCYLPAKRANWGFNFLMNTDMLPNGSRDDIEDIEMNHEIAKIAGRQFFKWIKHLISSGEYEMDSIFSLIPDFDECILRHEEYQKFIEEFQEEFEKKIKEEPFVPVIYKNGNESIACINNIVNDQTDITTNGVMSDSDFLSLMGMSNHCLPIQELRQSKSFKEFLYKHSPGELDIDFRNLENNCTNSDFIEWLLNSDNNNKFLEHLLIKEKLNDFSELSIFIEYKGELFCANDLYYDFDSKCNTISFMRRYVPHLSQETRSFFKDNEAWISFVDDYFMKFDAPELIDKFVFGNSEVIQLLEKLDNSKCFYKFIAEYDVDLSVYKDSIPFIDEDENIVYGFDGLLYFFNSDAYDLSKAKWMGNNTITILSHAYFHDNDSDDALRKTFENLGVSSFDKVNFICKIISGDDEFRNEINATIAADFDTNVSFLKYVYDASDSLIGREGFLTKYVLRCQNIEGDEVYLCDDDLRYFSLPPYAGNSTFDDNSHHVWLDNEMMYCLDPEYFEMFDQNEKKPLESFFRQFFGIKTFTNKSFFSEVVLKNKKAIYENLDEEEKLLAFLTYLKRDADDIFDGSLSFNDIKEMPLLCCDGSIVTERDSSMRFIKYDIAVKELRYKDWFPDGIFKVLSEEYTKSFNKDIQQLFKIESYNLATIINELIKYLDFQYNIDDCDNNIDFWRWIKSNQKVIENYEVLRTVKMVNSNGSTDYTCTDLFISDTYQKNGIESLVKKYDADASFVSEKYLEENTETNKNEWFKFFKKLGLKSDDKDILFNSILPNLSEIEDDAVVAMLTNHKKDLEEVWSEHRDQLLGLKVKTKLGEYLALDEVVIVNIDEDNISEPFKYIEISDEIDPVVFKLNKYIILLVANEFEENNVLTSKQEWANKKVAEYVQNIQDNETLRNSIHIDFIRELALLNESYEFSPELLSQLWFKSKDVNNEYIVASELTLGTTYNPKCDFESNGIDCLSYLSEDYISDNNKDTIISFFKSTAIHYSFTKEDIKFLTNRIFAVYFWSKCFSKNISEYEEWIEEGLFNDTDCIPTESSVKVPAELYSYELYNFARYTPDWTEKLPTNLIVDKISSQDARDIFNKLSFKQSLEFEDCLYYLLNAHVPRDEVRDKRKKIIEWILENEDIDENAVETYRNHPAAIWFNGKGKMTHISKLYAIHPDATQERSIFSGDEHVLQNGMLPLNTGDFERICEILKIRYLKSNDFITTPFNYKEETSYLIDYIKPKLLVLAAINNSDKYQERYEYYIEKISNYRFMVCDKIDLGFDTIHNDLERIYSDDSHIYYVKSWLHNRTFTKFCKKITELLEIKLPDNVCEDVLDDSNLLTECVDKYCPALAYNTLFRRYLQELNHPISFVEEESIKQEEDEYYTGPLSATQPEEYNDDLIENKNISDIDVVDVDESKTQQIDGAENIQNKEGNEGENVVPNHSHKTINNSYLDKYEFSHNSNTDHAIVSTIQKLIKQQTTSLTSQHGSYTPKQFTKEEIERMKSKGVSRCLSEGDAEPIEIEHLNNIFGANMSAEEIADTNYLAQIRLYQNLVDSGYEPGESEKDFVSSTQIEHPLKSGKYIHKCSATYGVLYISPSVWNKVATGRCIICVFLGKRAKDFIYLKSIDDILTWIHEDDILIKLTGEEKVDVVNKLYSGLLNGVTGTAYTLVRVASNSIFNSMFAPLRDDPAQVDSLDEM
jgi:hypothetical protein